MLSAYVRRLSGETVPVRWAHTGQHIGVSEGAVRLARLYWQPHETTSAEAAEAEQQTQELIRRAVPLMDVLILTRKSPDGTERAVFHGLVQEVNVMDGALSVVAADNPTAQHLFDQPFLSLDAPLAPSDAAPAPVGSLAGAQVRTLSGRPAARPAGNSGDQWAPLAQSAVTR